MDKNSVISVRMQKLRDLKLLLNDIDNKLVSLTNELNWDYKQLLEEKPLDMITCSINHQHRVPVSNLKEHEQKCLWHQQGYRDNDKSFPEHCGTGSFVTLTPELLHSIIKKMPLDTVFLYVVFLFIIMEFKTNQNKSLRAVPQTSANFDQNFNREEKLAVYDYVIANTQKQKLYSDLWLQPAEKIEEKKEMAAWEIAAAQRDAKRRRASYRNKVHTNRKTQTEILREVIEAQMEAFKAETVINPPEEKMERHRRGISKSSHEFRESVNKRKYHETSDLQSKDDQDKRQSHRRSSKHRELKRSPSSTGNDTKSRSRSHDKYRKWKTYEGRSHSHRSSKSFYIRQG